MQFNTFNTRFGSRQVTPGVNLSVLDIQTLQKRGMSSATIKALPLGTLLVLEDTGGYEIPKDHPYNHLRISDAEHKKQEKKGRSETAHQTCQWLGYQHNIYKKKYPNGGGLLEANDTKLVPRWKEKRLAKDTPKGWRKAKLELAEGLQKQFAKHHAQQQH